MRNRRRGYDQTAEFHNLTARDGLNSKNRTTSTRNRISTNWSGRETGGKPEDKITGFQLPKIHRIFEIGYFDSEKFWKFAELFRASACVAPVLLPLRLRLSEAKGQIAPVQVGRVLRKCITTGLGPASRSGG